MTANDWFDQGNALALQSNSFGAIGAYDEAIRLNPRREESVQFFAGFEEMGPGGSRAQAERRGPAILV